jgi:hypothetical protein
MSDTVQVMRISQILDLNTLVVVGAIEGVSSGTDLLVLSIGAPVPGTNAPLVLPKATVEVTQASAHYLIARPPYVVVPNMFAAVLAESQRPKKIRPQLQIDEKEVQGNPSQEPIRVGDIVIKERDLASYVDVLARQPLQGSDLIATRLAGSWLHAWDRTTNSGTEPARIEKDGRYFINGVHCFDLKSATFDPATQVLSFDKVGVPSNPNPYSKTINQREDLKVISDRELRGNVRGQSHITLSYSRE